MSHPFAASLQRRASSLLTLAILLPFLSLHLVARTQPPTPVFVLPPFVQAKDRITSFIDDDQGVTLSGNVHPLATSQYDAGAVAPGFSMEHMLLTLLPDAEQQDALPESWHSWCSTRRPGRGMQILLFILWPASRERAVRRFSTTSSKAITACRD